MEKQKSLEASKMNRKMVFDKMPPEAHREYLDMDTDEEEFGRRATPEGQDDAPPEPEKPEFSDEELETLVQQVKDLTVLPNLTDSSWTDSCLERIREYFCDPSHLVMCIFFLDSELRVLLGFPKSIDEGLAYFLRRSGQVYRPQDALTFGSVPGKVESTILKFVENLYAPVALSSEWPDNDNLSCVSLQLKSERVLLVTDQLKRVQSSNADDLKDLTVKVDEALEEAKSNLIYLDILVKNCKIFNHFTDVGDCLPKILYIVRFIFSESPYYNKSENIERLLCSLSICIIKICINNIDLKLMFDDVKKFKEIIEINFACLLSYSQIYDQIIGNSIGNRDDWKVDKDKIFGSVDAFKQRCQDISEICDTMRIYGSSNKICFGGTRGAYYESQYRRIKEHFSEIMNEMEFIICDYALDITEVKWFQDMLSFRSELDELENTMKNLLNALFEDVANVEMGIETLYTLFKFRERQCFADILHNRWTQVWKMFSEEIELSSEDSVQYELYQDQVKLVRSEKSLISDINDNYLRKLFQMMINASDWLGDCDLQFEKPLKNFSRKMSYSLLNK